MRKMKPKPKKKTPDQQRIENIALVVRLLLIVITKRDLISETTFNECMEILRDKSWQKKKESS